MLKVKAFRDSDFKELEKRLITWSRKMLGVIEPLDAEQVMILTAFLARNFGDFSMDEIHYAIELASAGKLDLDDNRHFQSLNTIYLGNILIAYRIYRDSVMKKAAEAENPPALPEITESQKLEMIRQGALKAFEEHKEKGTYRDDGNVIFNYLDKIGLIPFNYKRRREILENTRSLLVIEKKRQKESKKDKISRDAIQDKIFDLERNNTPELVAEARRRALNIFFDELKETGTELTDLLNQ